MRPSSSPATAKTKSAWASGRYSLTVPSPGPRPQQAAIHEGVHRAVDLIAVAAGGIEEAVDAARHVRQGEIGADQIRDAAGHGRAPPRETQAGEEELREPHRRHHPVMPRSGCLISSPTTRTIERDRRSSGRGSSGAQPVLREQPGGDHGEGRLDELGGLQRQARQRDPAPRALDLDAARTSV